MIPLSEKTYLRSSKMMTMIREERRARQMLTKQGVKEIIS